MYENRAEKGEENALEKRLHEMKDFPSYHRINIFEKGSLVGEEDVLQRKTYECTLKCHSGKGKVLRMQRDQFMQLKKEEVSLHQINFLFTKLFKVTQFSSVQIRSVLLPLWSQFRHFSQWRK